MNTGMAQDESEASEKHVSLTAAVQHQSAIWACSTEHMKYELLLEPLVHAFIFVEFSFVRNCVEVDFDVSTKDCKFTSA